MTQNVGEAEARRLQLRRDLERAVGVVRPHRDFRNLPPATGTSRFMLPTRWARFRAWLALMTIAAGLVACGDDFKFVGVNNATVACTRHGDSYDELTCVGDDGKAFICVRNWQERKIYCAPWRPR